MYIHAYIQFIQAESFQKKYLLCLSDFVTLKM